MEYTCAVQFGVCHVVSVLGCGYAANDPRIPCTIMLLLPASNYASWLRMDAMASASTWAEAIENIGYAHDDDQLWFLCCTGDYAGKQSTAIDNTIMDISSAERNENITRKTSRPTVSVPNKCSQLGLACG